MLKSNSVKWRFVKSRDDTYRIIPLNATIYALEQSHNQGDGTGVCVGDYRAYANQKWELEPVTVNISIQDPTGSSIGYIRNYHEYFSITDNDGKGLTYAQNAELTGIILDLDSPYSSKQSSITLQAALTPTESLGSIIWSSSNTNVATVNPNTGLVTAVGHGWTTITARYSEDSAVSDSIIVIVPNALMDVELDLQTKKNWCWVTSARMIMKYYFPEITASQEQGVRNSHEDINENTPESQINLPGSVYEAEAAAIYYSNNRVEAHIENFPSENELRAILDEGNPVYLTEHWVNGTNSPTSGGHVRVIYGYYEYDPGEYVYLIHDPYQWKSDNLIMKTQMSYANLLDECDVGIEKIDIPPVNQADWTPGQIIYWTIISEGGTI